MKRTNIRTLSSYKSEELDTLINDFSFSNEVFATQTTAVAMKTGHVLFIATVYYKEQEHNIEKEFPNYDD